MTSDEVIRALIRQSRDLQARVARLEAAEYVARAGVATRWSAVVQDASLICHYDGPEPYETDYTGNPTGHRGQVATVTGGVIYRPGRFGKAVQVAPETHNLIPNPSFETGTAGWTQYGTYRFGRTAEVSLYGGYSLKIDRRATGDWEGMYTSVTVTEGRTYTFSAYGRLGSGAPAGALAVNGCGISGTVVMARSTSWERASVTGTATSTGTVQVRVFSAGGAVGDTFYVDAVQVEEQPCATPYCDGSLGAGHSWTGTAHASTSTRAAARLSYALALPTVEGTIAGWFRASAGVARRLWYAVGGSSTYATTRLQVDGSLLAYWGDSELTSATGIWPADDAYHHVVVTRSATAQTIYLDGQVVASGALSAPYVNAGNPLHVGAIPDGTQSLDGFVDDLVIVGRCLDADEVRAIYESGAPVFAETSTWNQVLMIPDGVAAPEAAEG
ncbi:MAG: hypothetical protein GX657_05960, partial [Chloroflexi bacterium]|nr:hypothetical protein [Chloroflexota bacterium]